MSLPRTIVETEEFKSLPQSEQDESIRRNERVWQAYFENLLPGKPYILCGPYGKRDVVINAQDTDKDGRLVMTITNSVLVFPISVTEHRDTDIRLTLKVLYGEKVYCWKPSENDFDRATGSFRFKFFEATEERMERHLKANPGG